jgi:flagellar biosynthesis/type III secretory pathway M-ring protein FliF/YscJ
MGMGKGAQPSATVSIEMDRGRAAPQHLVDSAAGLLVGAQAGLAWERVSVIVDGVARRVRQPDAAGGMDAAEQFKAVEQVENRIEQKVANFFGIANLSVTVNFKVSPERKRTRKQEYDKDVIHKPIEENERTSETATPLAGNAAGDVGAMPNVGMSIPQAVPGSPGHATTSETESKSKFQILAGSTTTEVETPAGIATPVAAAVRVPRSYITNVLRTEAPRPADPNAAIPEPDEAAIQARFRQELPDFRTAVRFASGIESEGAVLVSLYTDLIPPMPPGVIPGAPNGGGLTGTAITSLAAAHSREIVLGGLAVVSLFMVSMMVRRAGPVVAGVAATGGLFQTPMPVLDAAEALAGEVGESTQMLDAMELDEDAVRAQQMLDQVSNMVQENPDASAGLVKSWLNRV